MIKTKDNNNIYKLLDEFNERLKSMESRISDFESRFSPVVEDKMAMFLTVPDTIRKSLFAVTQLGKCTADDVCVITGRHRSIENRYLNELTRSGWVGRQRKGKDIFYYLKKTGSSPRTKYQSAVDTLEKRLDGVLG